MTATLTRWERPPHFKRRVALGALAGFIAGVPLTLLALSVRLRWGPLRRLDHAIADALYDLVSPHAWAARVLDFLATALSPWVFRAAVLVLVLVLVSRGAWRLAWWAGITMFTGSLFGFTLKLVFERTRPQFADPIGTAPGYSFPSGHALNSAVGVLVILLVLLPALSRRSSRIAAWAAGGAVVAVTGFDRMALGVHYLSDVVAGWLVATALVLATAAAFVTWRRERGRPPSGPLDGVEPEAARRLA